MGPPYPLHPNPVPVPVASPSYGWVASLFGPPGLPQVYSSQEFPPLANRQTSQNVPYGYAVPPGSAFGFVPPRGTSPTVTSFGDIQLVSRLRQTPPSNNKRHSTDFNILNGTEDHPGGASMPYIRNEYHQEGNSRPSSAPQHGHRRASSYGSSNDFTTRGDFIRDQGRPEGYPFNFLPGNKNHFLGI